ncbi:ester cyclase [Marivita hallyeonensis]|uniref:SnoaL-like polyketide cyclase n=1 Tax=Marivita hallyeonensis TaxID=996342 RepID=A0A1M5P360_9RHOB|nr:ester cyclase [Marivita hallyeonensis]SHG96264.1 SnoaL-like polyketide cyclase [Marivita hallyeonensis]
MSERDAAKAVMAPVFAALRDFSTVDLQNALAAFASDVSVRMCHPIGDFRGARSAWEGAFWPLLSAMPDLERVDFIRIAGRDADGAMWIGSAGHYIGTWVNPWLGIPPTNGAAFLRFHEFFRIEDGHCVEVQAIWDIPEMMMQASVWPMAPQLGRFMYAPAPMTQDGLGPHDPAASDANAQHVVDMLLALQRHPKDGGPEVMELERFWHPKFMWYGPAGIGTTRGVTGFRKVHQIPFLNAMPDRGKHPEGTKHHFMAEGAFVGVTGWPNMQQTLSGDGFLGIPRVGRKITMRSLDFWRVENGLIRENWVLVDLLHVYAQIGVDVFARMEELKWSKGYR